MQRPIGAVAALFLASIFNVWVLNLAVMILSLVPFHSASAESIFWADEWGRIGKTNEDGSSVSTLLSVDVPPQGIAVAGDGMIYWTDYRSNTIHRTNPDGTGTVGLLTVAGEPRGIAVDDTGGKLYWAMGGGGYPTIERSNLDGSNMEVLVISHYRPGEMLQAIGIAIDAHDNKLFWTDPNGNQIWQANLDGTNAHTVLTGVSGPFMLALDTEHDKLFYTSHTTGMVLSANYDGSGLQQLITTGLDAPRGIALDLTSDKMYIADYEAKKIFRANIDGSDLTVIVTGAGLASGIALGVPEPSSFFLLGISVIGLVSYAWRHRRTA